MNHPRIPFVDLRTQYDSIRAEIDAAIRRVLDRCSFVKGPEVEAFEAAFAGLCRVEHCVACGNGTDALTLALEAVGVGPGDEVVTVAHTFIATAEAISMVGARPVFVDVRRDTLLMDVESVEAALTPRTRAIVPVHLYGQTVDMDPLLELARPRGIKVVEDAAQAHGATYRGRPAGALGDAATFSFYPGKNLGAFGDAGAVVTNDPRIASRVAKARDHGRTSKYEHEFAARNSRMDTIQAAVLEVKLRHLPDWNDQRRTLARRYADALGGLDAVTRVAETPSCRHVYHLFVVRVPRRDEVRERMNGLGVATGVHYPIPLHLQPAYRHLATDQQTLLVTERAAREVLSLPLYAPMEGHLVDRTVAALVEALHDIDARAAAAGTA